MAKYQIVGIEHREGTSKKTGKPYNMDVLHCVAAAPPRNPNITGNTVDTIPIGRDTGILATIPKPGEYWEISFNRAGYVEDAYACK